jgi:hypothetical protein
VSARRSWPEGAANIKTWANGGLVGTKDLVEELRYWADHFDPPKDDSPRPKTGPWLRRRDRNGDVVR